jgi:hypothetical protein
MARILIDTSVWIEFYHPKGSAYVKQALFKVMEDFGGPSQRDLAPRSI